MQHNGAAHNVNSTKIAAHTRNYITQRVTAGQRPAVMSNALSAYSTTRSLGSLEPISVELAIASKASSIPATEFVV